MKFGSLDLNLKWGQHPTVHAKETETQEHLDNIEDLEGLIDWLDGKMEQLDAPTESFDVESSIDLGSSMLQDMLRHSGSSHAWKDKEKIVDTTEEAEAEAVLSWGW
ncbi:hypothetical protein K439DRAFT_1617822 [Ramaria rubella]|nr:hypothetical protein K439DRAFT_1617822 [Ramaria rubella]